MFSHAAAARADGVHPTAGGSLHQETLSERQMLAFRLRSRLPGVTVGGRLGVVHQDGTNPAGGRLIGFWCLVCGYLLPAGGRQPEPAPTCAGSKVRTGRQHEPVRMQALLIN